MDAESLSKQAEISARRFWFKWLTFSLFVREVDPFAMFRIGSAKQTSSQLENARPSCECAFKKELRLAQANNDLVQIWALRLLRLSTAVMLIEACFVSYVQYKLLRRQYLSHLETGENDLLSWQLISKIEQLSGNPLAALKEVAFLLYLAPVSYDFVTFNLINLYARRNFVCNAPLRFLMRPHFELKRIDICIQTHLSNMKMSLSAYKSTQRIRFQRARSKLLSSLVPSDNLAARVELDQLEQQDQQFIDRMDRLIGAMKSSAAQLRPINLTPNYYARQCAWTRRLVVAAFGVLALSLITLALPFLIAPYLTRCPQLDCAPGRVFGASELLFTAQLWFALFLAFVAYSRTAVVSILLVINQLVILSFVRDKLSHCKRTLMINQLEQRDHLGRKRRDELVFRTLITLIVCDSELKRGSRALSVEATEQIYYAISPVVIFILSDRFNIRETRIIRYLFLAFGLCLANVLMISYAHVQGRILDYGRSLWSLMAVILDSYRDCFHCKAPRTFHLKRRREFLEFDQRGPNVKCCSFVLDMLAKFVLSSGGDMKRHATRALDMMELNYEKIIQANFFIIFLYSITATMLTSY